MAVEQKSKSISLDDNQVKITDFTTTDKDIHGYFAGLNESDDMDEKFEYALKIGAVAAKNIETAGHVHFFQKEANKISSDIVQKINDIFGEKGIVADIVTKTFGADGNLVKDILSPNKEGSPLQIAVQEISTRVHTDIEDLTNALQINKGKAEEAQRGTQKGVVFEKYCEPMLAEIAKMNGDDVRPTGTDEGSITGCKIGDFVYDIKELKKRISWEAKDYGSDLKKKKIDLNLDVGIKNREADYGILVSKYVEALPPDYGWFKELTNKKLVIALGTQTNDSELHPELLHIAYRWARARLHQETLQNGSFDPTFVQGKIKVLQEKLKKFKTIKLKCENIDEASSDIYDLAENLHEEIGQEFKEILNSLKG